MKFYRGSKRPNLFGDCPRFLCPFDEKAFATVRGLPLHKGVIKFSLEHIFSNFGNSLPYLSVAVKGGVCNFFRG